MHFASRSSSSIRLVSSDSRRRAARTGVILALARRPLQAAWNATRDRACFALASDCRSRVRQGDQGRPYKRVLGNISHAKGKRPRSRTMATRRLKLQCEIRMHPERRSRHNCIRTLGFLDAGTHCTHLVMLSFLRFCRASTWRAFSRLILRATSDSPTDAITSI